MCHRFLMTRLQTMSESPKTPINSRKTSTPGSSQTRPDVGSCRRRGLARPRLSDSSRKKPRIGDFKSPFRNTNFVEETPETLKQNISHLKAELEALDEEISLLRKEGYVEEELQLHIKKLHEYNELKDTGLMLLGKLGELECVQTKELYPKFGLDLED
ncbi:DNA repair protein SWI5 homolog [Ptychodera flava]|uniref:DNA repair protein SWI5 homolog n=1 Tax=Ptychodera flava TaxID=63121 RepID=UPI003969D35B